MPELSSIIKKREELRKNCIYSIGKSSNNQMKSYPPINYQHATQLVDSKDFGTLRFIYSGVKNAPNEVSDPCESGHMSGRSFHDFCGVI